MSNNTDQPLVDFIIRDLPSNVQTTAAVARALDNLKRAKRAYDSAREGRDFCVAVATAARERLAILVDPANLSTTAESLESASGALREAISKRTAAKEQLEAAEWTVAVQLDGVVNAVLEPYRNDPSQLADLDLTEILAQLGIEVAPAAAPSHEHDQMESVEGASEEVCVL